MKRQTKASRKDESLGERRGKESKKKQTYKSRRDESEGMSKEHLKEYAKYSPAQLKKHMRDEKKLVKEKVSKRKEAAAGRKYNKSEKHKKAESRGMKRAMRGK